MKLKTYKIVLFIMFIILIGGCCVGRSGQDLQAKRPFGFQPIYSEGSELSHFQDDHTLMSVFPTGLYGNEKSGLSFAARFPAAMLGAPAPPSSTSNFMTRFLFSSLK